MNLTQCLLVYEKREELETKLIHFIKEGLISDDFTVIIADEQTTNYLKDNISLGEDKIEFYNVHIVLTNISKNGKLDEKKAENFLLNFLTDLQKKKKPIRIYSELLDTLASLHEKHSAFLLDNLWNSFLDKFSFFLVSSFSFGLFNDIENIENFGKVSKHSSSIKPEKSSSLEKDTIDAPGNIFYWKQKSLSLEADIHKKNELLVENSKLKNKISLLEKEKIDILFKITNELRYPLQSLLKQLNLIDIKKNNPSEFEEYINIVKQSSDKLTSFLNSLLNSSPFSQEQPKREYHIFDMKELIHFCINEKEIECTKKKLEINFHFNLNKSWKVKGDKIKIKEIINYYLTMAVNSTNKGSVNLLLYQNVVTGNESLLELSIEIVDTGLGVEDLSSIPGTNSESLANQINLHQIYLKQLNGNLEFSSKLNMGTRVKMSLVLERAYQETPHVSQSFAYNHENHPKILIVEDDPISAELLKIFLKKFGHDSEIAIDGLEAIEILKKSSFDIIFIDINIPFKNGIELTYLIRKQEIKTKKKSLIIGLSSNVDSEMLETSKRVGMDFFFSKPLARDKMLAVLDRYIQSIPKKT